VRHQLLNLVHPLASELQIDLKTLVGILGFADLIHLIGCEEVAPGRLAAGSNRGCERMRPISCPR